MRRSVRYPVVIFAFLCLFSFFYNLLSRSSSPHLVLTRHTLKTWLPPSHLIGFDNLTLTFPDSEDQTDDQDVTTVDELFSHLLRVIGHSDSQKVLPSNCLLTSQHLSRYSHLKDSSKYKSLFVGISLDNQAIHLLPTISHSFVTLTRYLGPRSIYFSIFHSGSRDDKYHEMGRGLLILSQILDILGSRYNIHRSEEPTVATSGPNRRIRTLASIRNLVLKPLYDSMNEGVEWGNVLFLNDVVHCPFDLLEMIYAKELEGGDMMCAMDFKPLEIPEFEPDYPILFYDVWVARDMMGLPFYRIDEKGNWDLSRDVEPLQQQDPESHERYNLGYNFQVYSCWNGISIFSSNLLLSSNQKISRFNVEREKEPIKFKSEDEGDVSSECFLFVKDLYSTMKGKTKVGVAGNVRVAYDLETYEKVRWRQGYDVLNVEGERIQWKLSPPKRVMAYPYGKWSMGRWEESWED